MEYIIFIVFILIIFRVAFGLVYLLLYLPTQWIFDTNKLKKARLSLSTFIVVLITVFFFVPQEMNNKTATFEKYKD